MPAVVGIIAGFFGAFGIAAGTSTFLATAVLNIGISLVIGQVAKLFLKKPISASGVTDARGRTITGRQTIAPKRVVYGTIRLGGIMTVMETSGTNNEFFHLVITLSGHEVNDITAMYFDSVQVPYDGSGDATGNYAGFVTVKYKMGTRDDAAFADLVSLGLLTANHRQRSCAAAYVKLKYDQTKFVNGLPNITFDVAGRKVFDPRDGSISYSENTALCVADYLNDSYFGFGAQKKEVLTSSMVSQSGMGSFSATGIIDDDLTTVGWETDSSISGAFVKFDLGDDADKRLRRIRFYMNASDYAGIYRVEWSADDFTWIQAASDLRPDMVGWSDFELSPGQNSTALRRYWKISLLNSPGAGASIMQIQLYEGAVDLEVLEAAANICDEDVELAEGGTEKRYTCNGSFTMDELPEDVIPRMNSAMAGSVLFRGGRWGIYPAAWRDAILVLDDDDLRAPMSVQLNRDTREIFNSVKGVFISPVNDWQASDFPPYSDPSFVAADGNKFIWRDAEYPFTISPATAQRLSKIALRRNRKEIVFQGRFMLNAWQVQPMDVIQFTHPRFNWINKSFEVASADLVYEADASGEGMITGVDLALIEADATVYEWETTDESSFNEPPTPALPDPFTVQPPTGLSAASIARATNGIYVAGVQLTWTAPADQFVLSGGRIVIQFKRSADSLYKDGGRVPGDVTIADIFPLVDGTSYDFRIWAENAVGAHSSIVSTTFTPVTTIHGGLSYRPLSNPLRGVDAGTSAKIEIDVFDMRIQGIGDFSYSGGSILGLDYATLYYIYYDDPNLEEGTVTYVPTLIKEESLIGAGRFYLGSCVTPQSGGPDTVGNNDGGVGSQTGSEFPVDPSTIIQYQAGNGVLTDVDKSNNGGHDDFAELTVTGDGAFNTAALEFKVYPVPNKIYRSVKLLMLTEIPTYSLTGGGDRSVRLWVLRNAAGGGPFYQQVYTVEATRALTLDVVDLSGIIQNLSTIVVEVGVRTSNNQVSGSAVQRIYGAWLVLKE